MKHRLTSKELQRKILRDLFVHAGVLVIFSALASAMGLVQGLAQWTGIQAFEYIDQTLVIVIYAIWLSGIFLLRRLYELRAILDERQVIERELYHARQAATAGHVAGTIAHDFNNALMVINGLSEVGLLEVGPDHPIHDRLLDIHKAGLKAADLSAQLVRLSQKPLDDPKLLNINHVVSAMLNLLKDVAGPAIEIQTVLESGLPRITGNLAEIEEMIMNLVTNARDAMPDGGQLTLETTAVHADSGPDAEKLGLDAGTYVELTVRDTGHGIPNDIRHHIFEPAFTTRETGSGLGLAMVFAAAKRHGGSVAFSSEPQGGTAFKLLLPADSADDATATAPEPSHRPAKPAVDLLV